MAGGELDVCVSCGRMFARSSALRLCGSCALSDQARYQLVRDHIRANGEQTVAEVARDTGVSTAEIERYRSQGTLISRPGTAT